MNYYIIVFKNTHDSMKAEKDLKEENYNFRIMPTPTLITQSCGLCIRMDNSDDIHKIINQDKLIYKNIYERNECGFILIK